MSIKKMKSFIDRFSDILDELDALDGDEELEELNAQLEDSIFMLESLEEDEMEELEDSLEEMEDLLEEYREYASGCPDAEQSVNALAAALRMAKANLNP